MRLSRVPSLPLVRSMQLWTLVRASVFSSAEAKAGESRLLLPLKAIRHLQLDVPAYLGTYERYGVITKVLSGFSIPRTL